MKSFNQVLNSQLRKKQFSRSPQKTTLEGILTNCNFWFSKDKIYQYKLETYSGDVLLNIGRKHKAFVRDHIWDPVKVVGSYDEDGIAFNVEKIVVTYGGEELFFEPYLDEYSFDNQYYSSAISKNGKLEPLSEEVAC